MNEHPASASEGRSRCTLTIFLCLALLGGALALYSTAESYRLRDEGVTSIGLCSVGRWMDCRAAITSEHGYVFGIPISYGGFLFFSWCALLAAMTLRRPERQERSWRVLRLATLCASLFALFKAWRLVFDVAVLCPTCLLIQLLTLVLLLISLRASGVRVRPTLARGATRVRAEARSLLRWARRDRIWRPALLALLVLGIGAAGLRHWQQARLSDLEIRKLEALTAFYRQPVREILLPRKSPTRGASDASVHVVLFSDFQCSYCARIPALLEPYRDHVRVNFVHFPMDPAVNDYRVARGHELAALAARAGVVAQRHGLFWPVHDELFSLRSSLSPRSIIGTLARHGLTGEPVQLALGGEGTDDLLKEHIALARRLEIPGTPTLYVNGRRMGGYNAAMLDLILRQELRRAGIDVSPGVRDGEQGAPPLVRSASEGQAAARTPEAQ